MSAYSFDSSKPILRSGDLDYAMREPNRNLKSNEPKHLIIYRTTVEGSAARFESFPDSVPRSVQDILMQGGRRPYTHQAEAARLVLDEGRNVALVTPTASGKTISFLTPVLSMLSKDPLSTAMMIYPMNALANDQLKALRALGFAEGKDGLYDLQLGDRLVRASILTGDIVGKARTAMRAAANLLMTNHVALHHAILSQCNRQYRDGTSWKRFLANMKMLVLDEGHSYNGVEGTHAALTFRRLNLLVHKISGRFPQAMMASATIGNPVEHAQGLTGIDVWSLVNQSGAACYPREISVAMPILHPSRRGLWAASSVAVDITRSELEEGHRVLIFCSSRNGTEKMADRLNEKIGRKLAVPFHAGIPMEQKREFLERILAGKVEVVCATSALELGVDIGGMDTVVLIGHPGDHASFNQRAGRVGRTAPGRVFLVLDENQHPINAYLEGNPEALHWAPECRTIYPSNRIVATRHAACALHELGEPGLVTKAFPTAKEADFVKEAHDKPYGKIALVGTGNFGHFKALDPEGHVIQELGGEAALLNWHVRAIIRNAIGEFFRVEKVAIEHQLVYTHYLAAEGEPPSRRAYTTPKIETLADPIEGTLRKVENVPVAWAIDPIAGEFDVRRFTSAYTESEEGAPLSRPSQSRVRYLENHETNPPIGILTCGVMFGLGETHPLAVVMTEDPEGIRTVTDALALSTSLIVQARGRDVPVVITHEDGMLKFFIFDMAEGGMGWAEQLLMKLDRWLEAAGKALLNCPCKLKGCPRCSLSMMRGLKRKVLAEALVTAKGGLGRGRLQKSS